MDWEKIVEQIPTVIEKVRTDYVLNNMIIKDDIFGILENHCTVVYYPIENEINCGFHTKRFVKDKLEDFVYINTAKTVAEQVFAAAHELGHAILTPTSPCYFYSDYTFFKKSKPEIEANTFAAELLITNGDILEHQSYTTEQLSRVVGYDKRLIELRMKNCDINPKGELI